MQVGDPRVNRSATANASGGTDRPGEMRDRDRDAGRRERAGRSLGDKTGGGCPGRSDDRCQDQRRPLTSTTQANANATLRIQPTNTPPHRPSRCPYSKGSPYDIALATLTSHHSSKPVALQPASRNKFNQSTRQDVELLYCKLLSVYWSQMRCFNHFLDAVVWESYAPSMMLIGIAKNGLIHPRNSSSKTGSSSVRNPSTLPISKTIWTLA